VLLTAMEARVWDPMTAELLSTRVWPKPLHKTSLFPDGRRVIELTRDGAVRVWNIEGTEAPADLTPGFGRQSEGPSEMAASFNNEKIVVGNARQFGLWDIRRRTRLLLVDLSALDISSRIAAVALSSDGTRVASGHEDGTIRLWEIPSGQMLHQFTGHDGPVRWLTFNPIGTRLVSAAAMADRKVRIWHALPRSALVAANRSTVWIGEPLLTLEHEDAVEGLAMSADGATIATLNTSLHLWNSESLYSLEAWLTADVLRARGMSSLEAISTLRTNSSTNTARREALRYVAAHGDNPEDLRARAWHIVSVAGRSLDAYTRAVMLADREYHSWRRLLQGRSIHRGACVVARRLAAPSTLLAD
jgi:WD40 repeat protein